VARAVESAVRANARATFAKLLAIAPEEPRRLLALQLNRWDAANILALLRARLAGAGPREALAAVLPIGEMDEEQLGELAAEKDVRSLADALTTWKHEIGFRLRRAVLECGNPDDPRSLERDVMAAYFSWSLGQLRGDERQEALVRDSIQMHVDLTNVILLLGQVRERARARTGSGAGPGSGPTVGAAPGTAAAAAAAGAPAGGAGAAGAAPGPRRFVPPISHGTIPGRILEELAAADSLELAFETLMATRFAPGIEKGILAYGQAQSLAVMERFLEEVVIEQGCRLFRQDVLGMAVPLGFLWRKYCEMGNLRALCRGTAYGMSPNAIRQELVLV
jgi:vacuolar-type H+-ATPase subunit C/Vma6